MRYYTFNKYLRDKYGSRVQRISLDAGFTCPNRDGTIGNDGCIYCNEEGFSPVKGKGLTLNEQIEQGMAFAKKRYGADKFIAYFQSGTGTYGELNELKAKYDVILKYPEIVALFISTRPDSVDDGKLDMISGYLDKYEVWIEYGVQTVNGDTLDYIGRGHDFECSEKAVLATSARGIKVGAHVILGLPGEGPAQARTASDILNTLPIDGIKFHVLHVLRNTRLQKIFEAGDISLLEKEEYIRLVTDLIGRMPKDRVVLRLVSDARDDCLVAPKWINEKTRVIEEVNRYMEKNDIYQGKFLEG